MNQLVPKRFQKYVISLIFGKNGQGKVYAKKNLKHILIRVYRQCGKSWLFAYIAVAWASLFPKSTVVIITPTISQGLDTYWRDHTKLFDMLAGMEFRKSEKDARITLPNGSNILIRGVDNIENRRGMTADLLLCDEVAYYPLETYVRVLAPLTVARNGITLFASTPQGLKGNEFYEIEQNILSKQWIGKVIHMGLEQDPDITEEKKEEIKRIYVGKDQTYKREALAEYGAMESKAFPAFDTRTHVIDEAKFKLNPYLPIILGIDFGFNPDPNAVTFLQQQGKYIYQFAEHIGRNETIPALYYAIMEILERYKVDGVPLRMQAFCDPSNPGGIATLNQSASTYSKQGFFFKGQSDVAGWDKIRSMMDLLQKEDINKPDVTPQFFVTSNCSSSIMSYTNFQELPTFSKRSQKLENHEYSHIPDALKYTVNSGKFYIQNSMGEVHKMAFKIQEMYMPKAKKEDSMYAYLTDLDKHIEYGYDPRTREYNTM